VNDKYLSEAEWKKFSKGHDFKDAALIKALQALDKAERSGTDVLLKALDEVDRQAQSLLKLHKADKPLAAYLQDVDKALSKARAATQKAAELAAKQDKEAEKEAAKAQTSEDEEDDNPAVLTTKLVPLLRQLRKGGVVMKAVIAMLGKDTAVLVARRDISPARRKLLAQALGASGGVKYLMAECLFEENAYTFVVKSQAAGLAKKLKAALLDQTELRLKVRVRGEDPNDVDEDGEDEEGADGADQAPEQAGQRKDVWLKLKAALTPRIKAYATGGAVPNKVRVLALVQEAMALEKSDDFEAAIKVFTQCAALMAQADAPAAASDGASAAPTASAGQAEAASPKSALSADQLTAALNRLTPQINAAVVANPALKAELIKPVAAFQAHLKADRLAEAGQELKRLAALLAAPPGGAAAQPSNTLDQAMAGWSSARTAALAQLLALEKAIRGMADPEGDAAIILVKAIQANLTAKPATRQAVAELERYLQTDDIIDEAQGPNGFGLEVKLREPLLAALTKLRAAVPA
jgi:hypothetical protein